MELKIKFFLEGLGWELSVVGWWCGIGGWDWWLGLVVGIGLGINSRVLAVLLMRRWLVVD